MEKKTTTTKKAASKTEKTVKKGSLSAKNLVAKKVVKATKTANEKKASAGALEAKIYDLAGKSAGSVSLPEAIFGLSWNADLVHQVVTSMRTDARAHFAHVKTRGEVRGGGKKPWKQKGTGRARHGSTRSPIWVGGGVTHGPRNDQNYDRKVNKKMKAKAVFTILSRKLRDGEVLFVKDLALSAPKTKTAKEVIAKLGGISGYEMLALRRNNAALLATATIDSNTKRGFGNFSNMELSETRNINPLALLQYKYIVIGSPEESIKTLEAKIK